MRMKTIPGWHGFYFRGKFRFGLRFRLERVFNRYRSQRGWDPFADQ